MGIIIQESVATSMQRCYINYAMSVIVDRALPDARDGLKPVHKRILFDMHELGLYPTSSFKKSARIVGDTLGKYHPHGDISVYDAMVKLAQDFSKRYPLVQGHGNFGSIDGDSAAAMRYTEARLSRIGYQMLKDIEKNTVDFRPNFDNSELEPVVLPTLIPNLLVNGTEGIAVGMATNMPPHNISDIYDALIYIIDQTAKGEEANMDDLIAIVKAPDFPTGGIIIGLDGVKKAYKEGRGTFTIRSKYEVEEVHNKRSIIVTEIPYKVNKANLIEKIADLVKDKIVEGISDIRDESDRDGMRIVIDLKRDANVQLVINMLLKKSQLQDSYSVNAVALVNGQPRRELSLKELLEIFLAHAAEVILKRSQFDLDKANKRLNIVEGVLKCLATEEATDWVINTIRTADSPLQSLIDDGGLNQEQAEYVLDMKLRTLTKEAEQKLVTEKSTLEGNIDKWNAVINDESILLSTMKSEFLQLKEQFGDARKSEISNERSEIEEEELINEETLVVSITADGLIKSVEEKEYKAQGRGGKGLRMSTNSEEIIKYLMTVSSKADLLFFTNMGRCHVLKAYKIQKASRTNRGKSLNNYLNLNSDECVINVLTADLKDKVDNHLLFVTRKGQIKRLPMESLSTRLSITKFMSFKDGDELVSALIVKPEDHVIITTALGQSIRIAMNATANKAVRPMGREAAGVIGINVGNNDYVVDMVVVEEGSTLLTVTSNGLGKRTAIEEFGVQGRGGVGIIAHKVTEKTGSVVAATTVKEDDELFVATTKGLIIRINAGTINQFGRNTAGVKVINLNEGDGIVSISKNSAEPDDDSSEVSTGADN